MIKVHNSATNFCSYKIG